MHSNWQPMLFVRPVSGPFPRTCRTALDGPEARSRILLSVFLSWLYNQGHEIRVVSIMSLRGPEFFRKERTT